MRRDLKTLPMFPFTWNTEIRMDIERLGDRDVLHEAFGGGFGVLGVDVEVVVDGDDVADAVVGCHGDGEGEGGALVVVVRFGVA